MDENKVVQPELTPIERRVMRRYYRRALSGNPSDPNPHFEKIRKRILRRKEYLRDLDLIGAYLKGEITKEHLKKYLKVLEPDFKPKPFSPLETLEVERREIRDKEGVIVYDPEKAAKLLRIPQRSLLPIGYLLSQKTIGDKDDLSGENRISSNDTRKYVKTLPNGRIVFIEPKQAARKPVPLFYPIEPRNQGFEGSEGLAALAKNQVERLDFLKAELIRWKSHKPKREHSKNKRLRKIEEIEKEIAAILRKETAQNRASGGGAIMRRKTSEGEQSRLLRKRGSPHNPKSKKPPKGPR